ncbi:sulfatase-like hydrolase/transferase [Pseudomonas idahonensis]|uniref:sulfatase-like hydrolase/transferase n=1 Tax=Pseudomonas idahonensis TaxID=2942628 RepID=UPI0030D19BCC
MSEYNKKIAIVAWVFPFITFMVAPLAFYFGNASEYVSTLSSVLLFLCIITLGIFFVSAILLLMVRRIPIFFKLLSGLFVGIAIAAWVQSQIFSWDFGALDGRGVEWAKWDKHAHWELLVWAVIIIAAVSLAFRSLKNLHLIAQGTTFLGFLTLVSSGVISGYQSNGVENEGDGSSPFVLHASNNKILIILDTFQSDIFLEISRKWPEEISFLKGFTFYPDTAGGFPTTVASVPLIMTGEQYKNELPIKEWTRKENEKKNIADYFVGQKYGVSLVTILPSTLEGVRNSVFHISTLGRAGWKALLQNDLLVLDGGVFRTLPTRWKPEFYGEGNWFFSKLNFDENTLPGIHGQDLSFLEAFEKQAIVGSKNTGEFKFYHYAGAHWPLQLDEHFNYKAGMPEERASYIQQSRGVLTLLRRKLEKLKSLGVYDSSEILVVGDHGSHYIVPNDMYGSKTSNFDEISDNVLASSRPLFLYKPAHSVDALKVSEAPMQLRNAACIFSENNAAFGCGSALFGVGGRPQDARTFFYYHWTKEYFDGSKEFMPPMYKYTVKGDIRDVSSWNNDYMLYTEGNYHALPRVNKYKLGEYLSFVENGNAAGYFKHGWSYQEPDHRWTDGDASYSAFDIDGVVGKDLTLKFYGSAFLAPGVSSQDVDVVVNGKKIGSWKVSGLGWYEIGVPAAVVGKGLLNVELHFNEAVAPCDVMDSKDCRKLGVSVQSFVITEQGATH